MIVTLTGQRNMRKKLAENKIDKRNKSKLDPDEFFVERL